MVFTIKFFDTKSSISVKSVILKSLIFDTKSLFIVC